MVILRVAVAVLALSFGCYSSVSAGQITTYGVTATYRRSQLSAEVISSLGLRYGKVESVPTQLSFAVVSLRRLLGTASFVGIGETIENRQSQNASVPPLFEDMIFTRVAGLRIEAGHDLRLGANPNFELRANATPTMRGLYHNRYVSNSMVRPANLSAAA